MAESLRALGNFAIALVKWIAPKTPASPSRGAERGGLSTTVMLAAHWTHTASPKGDAGNSGSSSIKRELILLFIFFFK